MNREEKKELLMQHWELRSVRKELEGRLAEMGTVLVALGQGLKSAPHQVQLPESDPEKHTIPTPQYLVFPPSLLQECLNASAIVADLRRYKELLGHEEELRSKMAAAGLL